MKVWKLANEIACPNCGDDQDLRFSGEEVWENFFDGEVGQGCVCNVCGQRFLVWLAVHEIDWDEEEE
ncbi:MAG: hypothetical protein IIZ15_00820 [Coriobacteriales bacterium]|nr:hypothetical protein [Coriobacteriales bacterium]